MRSPPPRLLLVAAWLYGAMPPSPAVADSAAPAARPDAATKRCTAAQRRVERHQQAHEVLAARIGAQEVEREHCAGKRACDRVDRLLRTYAGRRSRSERQLEQLQRDAQKLCADRVGAHDINACAGA